MPKLLSEALAELGANVGSPIQEWTFNESVNIPAGSLSVGTTLELSEGGQDLVIADLINAQMAFSVNSDFDDSAGASLPTFVDYGAAQNTIPQPDFTTVITTNPITFTAPSTVVAPNLRLTDRITIKANGPVTNFRARVTDQATGLVIRYMPNKAAWDGVTAGVNLIAGDNTFFQTQQGTDTPGNFFLGFVPFVTQAGQTLDIEFIADAMDLLGTAGGLPYFATEIHDGPNVDLLASTDTLTNNFILRGGGNGIVQACTLDDIAGVFTDNDCDLIGVRPVADGTAGVELEDSGGIARQSWVYNDLTDTATVVFAAIGGADIVSTAGDLGNTSCVGNPRPVVVGKHHDKYAVCN